MTKKYLKRAILGMLVLLASVVTISAHTLAQGVPFDWNYINVDLDIQANGDMLVTESQQYNFTADHDNQRYRYIPLDKIDKISDVTVKENGRIIPTETGTENDRFFIRWQHQLKAPEIHTFILKYRVIGGLQVNSGNTHIYWKAIFGNRQAPVKNAIIKVHLPEVLSGITDFQYFGTDVTSREVNPKTFELVASEPIQPHQELEVQVTFPSKILNLPLSESNSDLDYSIWMAAFVTTLILFASGLWRT